MGYMAANHTLHSVRNIDPPTRFITRRLAGLLVHVLLIACGLIMFSPFIWMLSSAIKTPAELFQYPPQLIPPTPEWRNFTLIFEKTGMGRYFLNSVIVT